MLLAACSIPVKAPATNGAVVVGGDAQADWAQVLQRYVDDRGRVDFAGLAADPAKLDTYVDWIYDVGPHNQPQRFAGRDQQLAYYINAYNALAMYNVLRFGIPVKFSFLDRFDFFWRTQFVIGGRSLSLYDFENDVIRPLGDPRIHFALNCMVRSCPRLPRVPFRAATLNAQLNQAARLFFNELRNVRVDAANKTV